MSKPEPVPTDDWNAHWHLYADSATENPAQEMRHDLIARLLAQDSRIEMHILDLGSGQGDLAMKFERHFPSAHVAGFELSETGVALSRSKAPHARFVVADIFRPPPVLEEFREWATHAICSEVLEHLDDPVAFLVRAREYLQPGARLIVTVPGGPMSAFDRHIGHRRHFHCSTIRQLLEQAGYAVETTWRAGFPFFNLYRLFVIARGERLALDVAARPGRVRSRAAGIAMKLFRILFYANLRNSPFGWQIVATARKGVS